MTHWAYIHQKKRTEQVSSEKADLAKENKLLQQIVQKLLAKQELTDLETNFLKKLNLLS